MKDDTTRAVSVRLLDKEYLVGCPEAEQDGLRRASLYLDQKMREIRAGGKPMGLDRIAVMAALNIAHELLVERGDKGATADPVLDARLNALGERIDAALQRAARTDG
ncbi:cell division protein ZapA [Ectothiorhodospiraceae bacterium 2226]|nr:cell division protein ZapA [Ectothiorhodospiraceae bacterium 2226]